MPWLAALMALVLPSVPGAAQSVPPTLRGPVVTLALGRRIGAVLLRDICSNEFAIGDTASVVVFPMSSDTDGTPGRMVFLTGMVRRTSESDWADPREMRLTLETIGDWRVPNSAGVADVRFDSAGYRGQAGDSARAGASCYLEGARLHGRLARAVRASPRIAQNVPATAPHRIPAVVESFDQFVPIRGSMHGSRIHSSVIAIEFEDYVPRVARANIIALVSGRVIGGRDDMYFVQVARDVTGARILGQGTVLSALPGVINAAANMTMAGWRMEK